VEAWVKRAGLVGDLSAGGGQEQQVGVSKGEWGGEGSCVAPREGEFEEREVAECHGDGKVS